MVGFPRSGTYRLRCVCLTAALSFLFSTPRIWAQAPSPAALSWVRLSGAEACPGPAELARRVDALLKRSAFVAPSMATRFFQVSVQPKLAGVGWQTHIIVSNEADETLGTRELSISQAACVDAVDATALALALMIDPNSNFAFPAFPVPDAEQTTSKAPPLTSSKAEVPNVTQQPDCSSPLSAKVKAKAKASASRWRTRLGLGALGVAGALPDASFGVLAGVRVSPERSSLGIDVSAGYLGLQRIDLSAKSGAELNAVLAGVGAWVAPWSSGRLHISLAAGAQAYRITGCGFGFTTSSCQTSLLVSATADAELAWALDEHWGLALRPGVGVPFVRDTFQATAADATQYDISRPSWLIGWLSLGIVVSP